MNEREQQVLLMQSIYANATKTIMWLGRDRENKKEDAQPLYPMDAWEKCMSTAGLKDTYDVLHSS